VPFSPPDFSKPTLASAPDARFVAAPADGVLPDGFFSTTNLPTYVRIKGDWKMPREPRMDSALVLDRDGTLWVKEGRRVEKGDLVAVGMAEDGSEGILIQTELIGAEGPDEFKFMTSEVSREKPIDYALMASLLVDERERGGYPIWVTGPALVHSRARNDMSWFIANGFVSALLAGNAVAVHDIEASIFGTTLGMTHTGEATSGGHGLHMRAINKVRAAGSIANAVKQGIIKDGIMFSCVTHDVPFVLTGSIRDDGPLPDVITDTLQAQRLMRAEVRKGADLVLVLSSMLHGIATGNLLSASVTTVCVDINPAVVTKLADRGSFQAIGLVMDVEGFLRELCADLGLS
jgi:lysine-ketoglutarate reductase/saccharopine dehydrogenase-like protein (TIGR00300 family)